MGSLGPDSKEEMEFSGKANTVQYLTFGFTNTGGSTNTGKPGRYLFTMAPRQDTAVYRVDVYVK